MPMNLKVNDYCLHTYLYTEETNVNVDAKLPLVGVNVSLAINKTNDTLTVEVPKPVIPVIEGVLTFIRSVF
jgi:hypothetical protein